MVAQVAEMGNCNTPRELVYVPPGMACLPELKLLVLLLCRLNKCGVISPRYDVKHGELEAWVARLLPSRLVSALIFFSQFSDYLCRHWIPLLCLLLAFGSF